LRWGAPNPRSKSLAEGVAMAKKMKKAAGREKERGSVMKGRSDPGPQADAKYASIFEHSAVSLWEEDISRLRLKLHEMKTGGGFSLRDHLAAHPEYVLEAVGLIDVIDVNQATLRLFEADRKEQLLGPLPQVLDAVSRMALGDTILAIDEGKTDLEAESTALTLKGKKLSLIVKTHIPLADAGYPCMLVSLIDITARKQAEERARQSENILNSIIGSAPDAIYVKDRSLRMVLCNSVHSRLIGKKPKETYGKTDIENGWNAELISGNPEKGIEGWEKHDLAALSGTTVQISGITLNVDNEIRYFDAVRMPLRDQSDAVIGVIGIGMDVTERRKAEDELRTAKEFAENLIHTANVMVLGLDLEGRVTIFNTVAEEITGYARAELMNRSWFETVVPKERYPEVWREFEKLTHEGSTGTFENPILTRSGEERYIVWQNSQIREGDRVTGFLSFGIDITSRRRMEQDLAWERTLFNALMDNLPDYIYFKDSASRFIRTSWSHARVLGLRNPCEAVGKTDADFFGADHALKAFEDEQRVMKAGTPLVNIEERETYSDRPDTWVNTTKMPLRDPAGSIVGIFGISHDITARRQLEAKNQELATLVESTNDAIIGQDLNRRITVWNQGAERLYGYSAEEMIGTLMSPLIPPEFEDEARLIMERLMRGERITNFETTPLRKDGSKLMVSFTFSPICDTQGRIVGIASVARDVTAQKAMQAQVNRAQRLESLAVLAGGVAHQFNNINTIIKGYLDLMRSEKSLTARLASYVEAACVGVQKAVDITDRLLAMTEPGGSSHTLRLDVLARTLLPLHGKRIEEEKVRLVLDLAETPPVEGDEVRLKFVLSSLVGNALDSLLDRPVRMVSVRTGSTKDAAWFEVEDSGCGIPEEDLPRIFSPFFSAKGEWAAPGSPQARLKGVGLSLAISSTTVSEYGGRIDVHSIKGIGSTLRVVMPLAQ
jgi:PAS domain S-box-containing protein